MNQFEKAIQQGQVKCDICGEVMHPMYGGGWDHDRIVCASRECGAEIKYPTSTEIVGTCRTVRTEAGAMQEIDVLQALAKVAHAGGLENLSEHEALNRIRKLTLPYWDRKGR